MIRVEFHILSSTGDDARMRHACQLIEQSYQLKKTVYLRVESSHATKTIDELLWTFRDHAFIPHEIMTAHSPSHPRIMVLIGEGDQPPAEFGSTVINLGHDIPTHQDGITRLIEIVGADPVQKQQARERYKFYRDQGFQLETVNH